MEVCIDGEKIDEAKRKRYNAHLWVSNSMSCRFRCNFHKFLLCSMLGKSSCTDGSFLGRLAPISQVVLMVRD